MTIEGTHTQSFDEGLRARKEVLGADYADRSSVNVSDFSTPVNEADTHA